MTWIDNCRKNHKSWCKTSANTSSRPTREEVMRVPPSPSNTPVTTPFCFVSVLALLAFIPYRVSIPFCCFASCGYISSFLYHPGLQAPMRALCLRPAPSCRSGFLFLFLITAHASYFRFAGPFPTVVASKPTCTYKAPQTCQCKPRCKQLGLVPKNFCMTVRPLPSSRNNRVLQLFN